MSSWQHACSGTGSRCSSKSQQQRPSQAAVAAVGAAVLDAVAAVPVAGVRVGVVAAGAEEGASEA